MRISVCIATVRPATLESAILSVRRQTLAGWELIVVGQGESNALRSATERAAAETQRIRYLHLQRRGLSHARNTALDAAQAEIVAFMDDDCEAQDDWLEQLDRCFASQVAFVSGAVVAPPKPVGGSLPARGSHRAT